jgi:Cep192 domain 4/Abnormal spindle-like microcephaly-assoc'd, ASPM-SPD-2-Hydin/HYDIN/CFA65/VesB-like, Ig-like domain
MTVVAIVASVGLSSCAGYVTQAGATGQPGTSGTGVLSASSNSLSFGNVAVGSSSTQSVSVTNTGTAAVNISQATVSGSAFSVVGGNAFSSIPVGQSVTVQVRFAPQSQGAATGNLTVTSDASNTPLTISLGGTGMQPGLTISPASLNFNNVTVGQTSTQSVTLTNSGNADLVLNLATISGPSFGMNGLSLPKTLTAGQNLTFSVQFTPTSTTAASGSIVFTDNAPGSPQTLTMTGSAVAANSTLTANPGSVNFGSAVVGSRSTQTITLTNSGTATVTVNQVATTGAGFSASGINAGQTIAAGATASFTAAFAPTAAGAISGNITLTTNATNPTLSIALSGTGTQGSLAANPSSVNFGSLLVGSSGSVSVTLSNAGTAPVTISAASITGTGFAMTGLSVPQSINPGQTSSFTATFAPTSAGSASGSVSITSNAPGSPLTIALTGSATATQAQLTISPTPVAFNNVNVGSSATQSVTLANTGNASLNITAASITGSGYSMSLAAPLTINAGQNSTFTVKFAPTSAGSASGSISITSNAPGSPATIPLSGTGVQAQIVASPTSVSFGNVADGNTNSQPVTLTNNGNATLTFSQVTVTGAGFSVTGLTTSTTIAAGSGITFNAVFAPTSAGTVNGSIALTTNGSPAQLTISLTGTGQTATYTLGANPASLSFGNVAVGNSSSLTVTLTNTGNSNITTSGVTVSGAGFSATGITSGLTLTPSQTATLTVQFAPTATGDATGSVSVASNATTSPTTISLSGSSHSVTLSWIASTSTSVTGYYVYRGTTSGQYTKLNPTAPVPATQLAFTDTSVQSSTTYYYAVTAVDSSNAESTYSNQATAIIP